MIKAAALMVPLSGSEATMSLTSVALLPSSTSARVTPDGSRGLHWMMQSYIFLRHNYSTVQHSVSQGVTEGVVLQQINTSCEASLVANNICHAYGRIPTVNLTTQRLVQTAVKGQCDN